jgi:hypothetical protein
LFLQNRCSPYALVINRSGKASVTQEKEKTPTPDLSTSASTADTQPDDSARISPEKEKTPTPDSSTSAGTADEHPDDTAGVSPEEEIPMPDSSTSAGTANEHPDDFALGGVMGGDMIGMDMPIDDPEPETPLTDVDMVLNTGASDETGTAIHRDDRTSEAVTSGVTGKNSDDNNGRNGDDVAMPSEAAPKPSPAVRKAPVPIRYQNGKRVSEYEWERNENIKANQKLLQVLELKNAGEQVIGRKKGKENKDNEDKPSTKRKKLPWASTRTRTLRSMGKLVTNMYVYVVVHRHFVADSSLLPIHL